MCTAINFHSGGYYFGRNLDLEYHYDEQVVITPRGYPLRFRRADPLHRHHAMIGMATVADGYPLYYEATNEHGVSIAGLNFPQSARYFPPQEGRDNIAPYEFIPWVLGQCRDMAQVRALLARISLLHAPFGPGYPLSPLHWMISFKDESLVVESMADGLHIYDNPAGVMTNNPPFPMQLWHLSLYGSLSPSQPAGSPAPSPSNGMGAHGLPGDWSSSSRFVRAAYALRHAQCRDTEAESISQFFHMLAAVAMPRGCVDVHGKPEITVYACCCRADRGIYCYTTYENSRITAIDMRRHDLSANALVCFPLETNPSILRL